MRGHSLPPPTLLLEDATLDQLEGEEGGSFLQDGVRVGRHGARADAPNVRVVAAVGHEEHRTWLAGVEHLQAPVRQSCRNT